MKVGFVFTNYNNSALTRQAIASLARNREWGDCHVVVVDNNSASGDVEILRQIKAEFPEINLVLNSENVGYFAGLNVGIRLLRGQFTGLDHIVVGNNDLVFPPDFMERLQSAGRVLDSYAVVSPDLVTLEGVHQNPHVLKGISRARELIWDVYYSNYVMAIAIKLLARVTRSFTQRKDYHQHRVAQTIYTGYGACYILGPVFFRHFDELWAPTFLMGEEFFLGKQLRDLQLEMYYEPGVLVNHHDHATLNKVPSRRIWEMARESHRVYRQYVPLPSFRLAVRDGQK